MPREKKNKIRKDKRYRRVYHGIPFYSRISDEDAKAKRDEYIRNEKRGFSRQTVEDYALPWLKRTYPAVADSTYTGLAIHLQHLIDQIGKRQLYCSLFDAAQADGLIKFNPAREKSAKPHTGKKPKERKLSKQERIWIETLCTDHRAWPAVMCMLYAGLRPQECKALKIDRDVDFKKEQITLREFVHVDGTKYQHTKVGKTEKAARTIPLFPPLKEALEGKKGYLITSAAGKRVNTIQTWKSVWASYVCAMETAINGVQKRWYGKRKQDKEEKPAPWISFTVTPYDLRHS